MRRATAATIAAAAVWIALSAAPALAAPPEFFGIMKGQPLDRRDFRKLKSTGVGSLRFAINWYGVERRPQSRNWAATDKLVGNLAARGIRPVPFVYGSPRWVAKRPNRPPINGSADVSAWQGFLTRLVERYGPGGTYWTGIYLRTHPDAAPKPITAWQIWNEPNLSKFFPQKGSARKYGRLLRISHEAIAAVDSSATIVLAGMPGYARPTAWGFLDRLYHVGGVKPDFDAAAVHPYSANIAQFRAVIRHMRGVMAKHHDAASSLWITEIGWGSAHPSRRWPLNKGPRGQRRMLQKSFGLVLHRRASWHVGRLFWFDWRDPKRGRGHYCSFCDSAGLLRHNHAPKPAYRAYRRFAR